MVAAVRLRNLCAAPAAAAVVAVVGCDIAPLSRTALATWSAKAAAVSCHLHISPRLVRCYCVVVAVAAVVAVGTALNLQRCLLL